MSLPPLPRRLCVFNAGPAGSTVRIDMLGEIALSAPARALGLMARWG